MRWGTGCVLAMAGLWATPGCGSSQVEPEMAETARSADHGRPDWLPAYTADQEALLTPGDTPVVVPARRTFPDLERFGYSNNRLLRDPRESLKFTRMVAQVLQDSPRLYSMTEIEPALENPIAQYGPPGPDEADAWYVAQFDEHGLGSLARAPVSDEAAAAYEEGTAAHEAEDYAAAAAAFAEANRASPGVPAILFARAESLNAGASAEAESAYQQAIAADPTFSSAHRGYAAWLLNRGDVEQARTELALALAYHPGSKLALELARQITPEVDSTEHRPKPFRIFLDVDPIGAVRIGAAPSPAAQIYAGCRAIMRYEPELRAAIFEQPPPTPYYLSVAEEVLCLESAIGAYLFDIAEDMQQQRESELDPRVEGLLRLAQAEGLSGYAMFEILGRYRPERARTAPPDVHRAVFNYVDRHVLGEPADLPPGHIMASAP